MGASAWTSETIDSLDGLDTGRHPRKHLNLKVVAAAGTKRCEASGAWD
jgi:hypothetical protein